MPLIFFVAQPKSAIKKTASDNDEDICHRQPSSPATASRCPVNPMLPSTFVGVAVAVAWAVAVVLAVTAVVGDG
jgi:hypothetical protein